MIFKESGHLELKEMLNADFKKEIIAFANTDGGEIYVGIGDDGTVVGIPEPDKMMEQIGNMIRDGIKPDLTSYTDIECLEMEGKKVVRVYISCGSKRPYHLTDKGLKPAGVYLRHGVSSVPASEEAIRQMIKDSDGTSFDKMRSANQELTFDYAEMYFEKCKVSFTAQNQRTLGLINADGYYTNAALLLSEQCAHSIKCAVYEGTGKTKFKARKEFFGSVLKQLEDAYEYLSLNNNLQSDFEGLHRVERQDYPEFALREALLNTIVHRDYDYSGSTLIHIFTDRIEFVSLGGLVKGITLEDIMHGASQSRNMLIASVFYRLRLIESYGTGIQRILESYSGYGRQPEFVPAPASFLAVLKNLNIVPSTGYEEDPSLSDSEKILSLLRRKGEIDRRDVESLLKCSSYPANRLLNELMLEGKILRIGKARATKYIMNGRL